LLFPYICTFSGRERAFLVWIQKCTKKIKAVKRQDWPRVPLPSDGATLRRSAELGREVAALLDVEQDVDGVTTDPIRPALAPLGVPTPVGARDQLSREDFAVTAGWGYTAHHGATMPGGGETEERALSPEEEAALPDGAAERWGPRRSAAPQ
jgi:hypothetical protein